MRQLWSILVDMSDTATNVGVPTWELRHRLVRSMEFAGLGAEEMAEFLGMHHNSVYGWTAGKRVPKIGILRLWAMRTGVPYEWLLTGQASTNGPDDGPARQRAPRGDRKPCYLTRSFLKSAA